MAMNTKPVDVEALRGHTPGPWTYQSGGGHAPNRIVGAAIVQVGGWLEDRGSVSNRSYSDCVCENLGDIDLPFPAANARLIAAAPDLLAEVIALRAELAAKDAAVAELVKLAADVARELAEAAPYGERDDFADISEARCIELSKQIAKSLLNFRGAK